MLKKIISIKNIGRFLNYGASGDVVLKRYNLVFAENGRGKTTLCAILRSALSGDPSPVIGRASLGSTDAPKVEILTESGYCNFSNGAWSDKISDIAIFDSTFVSENVFSGDSVDIDQRRSLYRVIVGKQGVELAQQIESLDADSRAKSATIKEKANALQPYTPKGLTLDAYLGIAEDPNIDDKIAAQEKELEAVRQSDQIKNRSLLSILALPAFPADFDAVLDKTIEAVSKEAERRVADQIKDHSMDARGNAWLSEGLGFIHKNECPFCSQSLDAAQNLIASYNAYFSAAFKALRGEIAAARSKTEVGLGDKEIAQFEKTVDQNNASVEFWAKYCDVVAPPTTGPEASDALRELRHAALVLLDRKANAPLDAVAPDADFADRRAAVAFLQGETGKYNEAVTAANVLISAKKAATAVADVKAVEARLSQLRTTKKRHAPDVKSICNAHSILQLEKKAIEEKKAAVRERLDAYTTQVIGKYEHSINQFLDDFHAGFRITETKHGYPGGVASSNYQIFINSIPVELGDAKTPLDKPSFRNTLSAGDKSVLALAFFLAQLDHDPDKASKIVVFDDPFNSQDSFRKDCTIQKIKKCGEFSRQVIVLSHDQYFLKRVWDKLSVQASERKCLEMARVGQRNTIIVEWDIEKATLDHYRANRQTLSDYYIASADNPRDVVQKIRPVLETYCKNLGGNALTEADTLGVIVGKIRMVGTGHTLYPLCDGLEELNDYTKRYHHGENPQSAIEPISDTELQGYVKRTLEMTGGC